MDSGRLVPAHRSAGNHPLGVTGELARKYDALLRFLADEAPGTIAVSGGLDSRLLAHLARSRSLDYSCLHFSGPHVAASESASAAQFLDGLGLPWATLHADILTLPPVAAGARDRCYHCKRALFSSARRHSRADRRLMDGTNTSDHKVYRPGIQALAELGIRSPFALCGLTKDDIRALALAVQLPNPDQPSTPCLLTRLPYGTTPDPETLATLAALEDDIRALGLRRFRVRLVDGFPALFVHTTEPNPLPPLPTTLNPLTVHRVSSLSGHWDRTPE